MTAALWNKIPVTGTYKNNDGSLETGGLTFTSTQSITDNGVTTSSFSKYVDLVNGAIPSGFYLPATSDPDANLTGTTYMVTESLPNAPAPFPIFVPYSSGGIDMATVSPFVQAQNSVGNGGSAGPAGATGPTGATGATGTSPTNAMQEADVFTDYVVAGLLTPISASLSSTLSAGSAYVTGQHTPVPATPYTYTASQDTYVDLTADGALHYLTAANGGVAPSVTTASLRLQKVVTSATAVTAVVQLASVNALFIAAAAPFGLGDALRTQFPLPDGANVAAIHQTDWQGRQLLYATPRTEYVPNNDSLDKWFSYGAYTLVKMTDPVVGTFWRLTKTGGVNNDRAGIRINPLGLSGSSYTVGAWVRSSSSTTAFVACYVDASCSPSGLLTTGVISQLPVSQNFVQVKATVSSTTKTMTGAGSIYIWVESAVGDYIDIKFPSLALGAVLGASFATTTAPVTVTDYVLNGTIITTGQPPAVGAVLDWDGTDNPLAPPSAARLSTLADWQSANSSAALLVAAAPVSTTLATVTASGAGQYEAIFSEQCSMRPGNVAAQNSTDLAALVSYLSGLAATNASHAATFGGGETLTAGVYTIASAASLAGTLTLSGSATDVFVFRITGAFGVGASSTIALTGGAQSCNVFIIASGAVGVGASSTMVGSLIATGAGAVGMGASCTLDGRMLCAGGGAVTSSGPVLNAPLGVSSVAVGNLQNFVAFSVGGDVTNTGTTSGVGDVCIGPTATTLAAWSGISGNVYTQAGVNARATFDVAVAGVSVPGSRRVIESQVYLPLDVDLAALAAATAAGQTVTARIKVDCGTVYVPSSFISIDRKA